MTQRRRHQFSNMDDLFQTVANGNLAGLESYLKNGGNVDLTEQTTKATLLHHAVKEGNIEKVRLLVDSGCSMNLHDGNSCTPVFEAIEHGYHSILELLLNAEASGKAYVNHTTPLILAVMKEDLTSVKTLVDKLPESDIQTQNYVGQSALTQAVITNNVEICDYLLKHGAVINCDYGNSFAKDIAKNLCTNIELLKTFLKYNCPEDVRFLLMFSCTYNLIDAAKIILLKHKTPFHLQALGFLTQREDYEIWLTLIQTVVRCYKKATKCAKDNALLEMLLSFCQLQSYDKTLHKNRAKELIRILLKYGLMINPMTCMKSCSRECVCRRIIFTALYDQDPVPSLKAQCCSVIRQSLRGEMYFDINDVSLLPLPKLLQDFICMKDW